MDTAYTPWGTSLAINLFDCNHELLISTEKIQEFIQELISVIDMKAHGPCYVERFGHGELEGISAMQFIETSSITIHCDEKQNRVFIDIFTCKELNHDKAITFCKEFFSAQSFNQTLIQR
jgi:S-adenosylmethionine/arginine decarboxylase-like enzyme